MMYACAANEAERTAIHDVIFGSAMDAIDRYLPDKHKHAVLRSMLAFLAINSTYRGPIPQAAQRVWRSHSRFPTTPPR